jgi:lipopolysaccharide/colanic/teichoic acid biosynthesis glycosyltransferase
MINVLRGEMSFVGPRPERSFFIEQLKEEIPFYFERHIVKPGITGWAQIRYPYGASKEDALEKLKYDLYYIKHMSTFFDLMIILETIKIALMGKGAR